MLLLLIPGLWLDGSSWDAVTPALEAAGHRVRPLTLPGMTAGAQRRGITLRDHVDAVVAAIDEYDDPVVLVGHSAGGAIAHGAVDARPDRVAHVIYVDDVPRGEGECVTTELPIVDGEIPLPDWSQFEDPDLIDLTDELKAQFRERAIPSPARIATDPQRLSDERRYDVGVTVICCEFTVAQLQEWMRGGFAAELGRIRDVRYVELPTGHWPQFTRPADLAAAILSVLV